MVLNIFFIIVGLIFLLLGLSRDSGTTYAGGALLIVLNVAALLFGGNKKEKEPKVERITAKTVQVDTLININKGVRDTTYVITKID